MIVNSAQDPESALEKMDADPGHEHFYKIYWIFFHKAELVVNLFFFFSFFFLC